MITVKNSKCKYFATTMINVMKITTSERFRTTLSAQASQLTLIIRRQDLSGDKEEVPPQIWIGNQSTAQQQNNKILQIMR